MSLGEVGFEGRARGRLSIIGKNGGREGGERELSITEFEKVKRRRRRRKDRGEEH